MFLRTKIKQTFIFGNIFVAVCAYFQSLQILYFTKKLSLVNPASLFVFFATLLIYNYRKLFFATKELSPPLNERSAWVINNKQTLAFICMAAICGVFILMFSFSFKSFLFLVPLFIISVLYATPFSKKSESNKRLRHLPFLKIFLVAGVWSATVVLFPIMEYDFQELLSTKVIFSFSMRFLFLFAITIPFDIRDMELDRKNGIKTFPVVYGVKGSVQLSVGVLLLFIIFQLLSLHYAEFNTLPMAVGYIFSALSAMAFVVLSRDKRSEYFVSFWIEGLMLFQFICLLLTNSFY